MQFAKWMNQIILNTVPMIMIGAVDTDHDLVSSLLFTCNVVEWGAGKQKGKKCPAGPFAV